MKYVELADISEEWKSSELLPTRKVCNVRSFRLKCIRSLKVAEWKRKQKWSGRLISICSSSQAALRAVYGCVQELCCIRTHAISNAKNAQPFCNFSQRFCSCWTIKLHWCACNWVFERNLCNPFTCSKLTLECKGKVNSVWSFSFNTLQGRLQWCFLHQGELVYHWCRQRWRYLYIVWGRSNDYGSMRLRSPYLWDRPGDSKGPYDNDWTIL